jgi:hypothetical protein
MATRAINYKFLSSQSVPFASYDSTKTVVGDLIKFYTGANPQDNYTGPLRLGMGRPMEQAVPIPALFISVIKFSQNTHWVFYGDGAAAAVTRRVGLYEFDVPSSVYTWKGYVILNYPAIGNKTLRGNEVTRDLYTLGTVSCSGGTTVTGVSTTFQSSGLSVGSRIGFASSDPTQIAIWYEIASITNDTELELTTNGPTISGGNYVIEDLRIVQILTNATATNGGVHVVKGLRVENFSPSGISIPAATTIDNIRAVYWLKDAVTQTNTIGYGIAIDNKASWTSQDAYVVNANALASGRIFKYNLRAPLTLSSGASTDGYLLQTAQLATSGNISATGNGSIAVSNHGPGSGIKSLYWVTVSRVYRSDVTQITEGSSSYQSDVMVEIPPGGTNTYAATSTFSNIEYSSLLDRFIILNTGASSNRSYVTDYNTLSNPFEVIFLSDDKQLDQSSSSPDGVIHPTINLSSFTGRSQDGILHLCRFSTLATLNQIYSVPIGAHQTYAFNTDQYLITPKFNLSGANKMLELNINNVRRLGSDTFALSTEPFRVYYRTTGIDDNTGSWNQLNDANSLSSISPGEIQFAITFRTMGTTCIPPRLISLNLVYEDDSTDSHYLPSVDKSSVVNKQFAYVQILAFGTNIPELRIRIFNAVTNSLVLDDNTTDEASGTFEYSVDGTTWSAWDNTEDTVGNYIRYTAASLPNGIKVRVLLTQ